MNKPIFQVVGLISTILLILGIIFAVRVYDTDIGLFFMWLSLALLGFIGLAILVIRIFLLKRKINTPRE